MLDPGDEGITRVLEPGYEGIRSGGRGYYEAICARVRYQIIVLIKYSACWVRLP